jgi:hypothetical protein
VRFVNDDGLKIAHSTRFSGNALISSQES